jgi:hypothetical protein
MMKAQKLEQEQAREELRKALPSGSTLYTVLRHCSRSGTYRAIDIYSMHTGEPLRYTWSVAKACGMKYDRKHEAIGIRGCGMDMGFAIVNDLAHYLYPNGFACVGEQCPSNDHSNGHGNRNDGTYHVCPRVPATCRHHDTPGWHKTGAYALSQRWL